MPQVRVLKGCFLKISSGKRGCEGETVGQPFLEITGLLNAEVRGDDADRLLRTGRVGVSKFGARIEEPSQEDGPGEPFGLDPGTEVVDDRVEGLSDGSHRVGP